MRWTITILIALATGCGFDTDGEPPGEATSEATVAAIPRGSVWKYWDRGGDLGTAWRVRGYDDATWASGPGPLGYGESYLSTSVSWGSSSTSRHITTYFRGTFEVTDPAAVTGLHGEVMYDDGVVIYLNGVEIERNAMPSGTITAATLSTGHEAGNSYRSHDWSADRGLLVAGTNVIAVEVHQASPSSSDLVFDLSLSVDGVDQPEPPPVSFGGIERTSHWSYWDQGGDQGSGWRTLPREALWDQGWELARGSFGYGESYHNTTVSFGPDPASKHITTYFQHEFTVQNPSAVTSMIASVMYDDGFVAYLNGVEIARASMPTGTITAATRALGHETGNTYERFDWSTHRHLLLAEGNKLAVEVHQASPSSSDLSFDLGLELGGQEPPPPPDNEEDIARGSVWRYWDRAAVPSTYDLWAFPEYDDSAWASGPGPLGYGESYVKTTVSYGSSSTSKNITTYFRRWFTVDHPTVQTTLIGELMYDDGVVVYLNGREIARLHMPSGDIEHDTRSTGHETGNRYERYDWSAFNLHLRPGPNLIAVEVHQASPSSSDLVFDLALQVDTPEVCGIPYCGPAIAPTPATALNGVWVGPGETWVVGADGAIGRLAHSAGVWCWCQRGTAHYTAVWGNDQEVWIVGTDGRIVRYGGAVFSERDAGTTATLNGVWGSGPDDVWVVGRQGTARHYDGDSWTAHDLGSEQGFSTVWGASAGEVWIGGSEPAPYPDNPEYNGSSAIIYRWQPAEGAWALEMKDTRYYGSAGVAALHGTGAGDVWAVGHDHPAGAACSISEGWHRDDSGWSSAVPYPYDECQDFADVVAGAPGAEDGVWIVGGPDAIRYRGGVWSAISDPVVDNLQDVDYRGDLMWAVGSGWTGGYSGGFRHKIIRWDGSRWVQEW